MTELSAMPPDRRLGTGRRRSDEEAQVLRDLVHDVGHGLATLSHVVEAVRADSGLSAGNRRRLTLMEQEISRLVAVTRRSLSGRSQSGGVAVRDLLAQIASLADLSNTTSVRLLPGSQVTLQTDGALLWRTVGNLVHNAVRAAGPQGHVELSVDDERGVVIEVADDGPGFGTGPSGWNSMGLRIARGLSKACGADLHVLPAEGTGTTVRLAFAEVLDANRRQAATDRQ